MMNLEIPDDELWLLASDFNFYRSEENKNREGGNLQDMCTFNTFIKSHGLVEILSQGERSLGVICKRAPFWNK
jgi:hypothetical protein